ncbi:MAG: class I SAM-dependent methyltransferase [Armatimonadota bacterium]
MVLHLYEQGSDQMWSQDSRDIAFRARQVEQRAAGRRILDIGCFTGRFLNLLGPNWTKLGIEPIPWAAHRCREQGIQILADTVDDWIPEDHSLDVVTMWDVIEHLDDVESALRKSWAALTPGGLLAFETGNAASWFARLMGPDWWYTALPEHRSFLSPNSAKALLERCGFTRIEAIPTSWQSMGISRTAVQLLKATAYRTVSLLDTITRGAGHVLLSPLLQRTPPCILLRDHMLVFARKPE